MRDFDTIRDAHHFDSSRDTVELAIRNIPTLILEIIDGRLIVLAERDRLGNTLGTVPDPWVPPYYPGE